METFIVEIITGAGSREAMGNGKTMIVLDPGIEVICKIEVIQETVVMRQPKTGPVHRIEPRHHKIEAIHKVEVITRINLIRIEAEVISERVAIINLPTVAQGGVVELVEADVDGNI